MGLVLVADAPGRLPKPLAELKHLVSGGYSKVWEVPWVEAWRLGNPPDDANTPKNVRRLVNDLRLLTGSVIDVRRAGFGQEQGGESIALRELDIAPMALSQAGKRMSP
jgi:hypothetical protein